MERPTQIALNNHLDIHFEGAKVRQVLDDGLSLRGFLAATREGDPIHDDVAAAAIPEGGGTGDYIAGLDGPVWTPHLTPYLWQTVWIVGESVPPGGYREAFPVTVVEDQGA